jgi:hypothetical protein
MTPAQEKALQVLHNENERLDLYKDAYAEQKPVISKWSLREVYFDEDGEPLAHRSPPEQEPVAWRWKLGNSGWQLEDANPSTVQPTAVIEALYTTPPQHTEQEPVAWGVFEGNLHDMFFTQEEAQEMASLKGSHAEVRPLTAPPQRTWVGLTDKVITKVVESMPRGINGWMSDWDLYDYARAIEAKLKEKNFD